MAHATYSLTSGSLPSVALCTSCASKDSGAERRIAFKFYDALASVGSSYEFVSVPDMPGDLTCSNCGLTFRELRTSGLMGCEKCYSVFEPAIFPAILSLQAVPAAR